MDNRPLLRLIIGTAIILAAILVLAAWYRSNGWTSFISDSTLHVDANTENADIVKQLLAKTPIGSSDSSVLQYISSSLKPRGGPIIYAMPDGSHTINVCLGQYSDGRFLWRIETNWKFDSKKQLTVIEIFRNNSL